MRFKALLLALLLFICSDVAAQEGAGAFEQLPIQKPRPGRLRYTSELTGFEEVQLKLKDPKRSPNTFSGATGDATRNVLAGLFGGNISTSESMTYLLRGELETDKKASDWQVLLFCPGQLEKTSTRVRNNDGSKSVQTERTTTLFWAEGAYGMLLADKDTLARFNVSTQPMRHAELNKQINGLFDRAAQQFRNDRSLLLREYLTVPRSLHFTATGSFRGKELVLLFDDYERIAWIFLNGALQGVFRADTDDYEGMFVAASARNRVQPYLLCPAGADESVRADCLRLALFGRLLFSAINQPEWSGSQR